MTLKVLKQEIVPILRRQGAIKIALFGSFAKGEETENSDIDILAKFKNGISLLKLVSLQFKLEEKLGRKVDLLTYGGINPRLRKVILEEQKILYEKKRS